MNYAWRFQRARLVVARFAPHVLGFLVSRALCTVYALTLLGSSGCSSADQLGNDISAQFKCGPNGNPKTHVHAWSRGSGVATEEPSEADGVTVGSHLSLTCGANGIGPPDSQTATIACPDDTITANRNVDPRIYFRIGPFDLRALTAGESRSVEVGILSTVDRQDCSSSASGVLSVTQATGQAANAPACEGALGECPGYVTSDFSRHAVFTLDVDGASLPWRARVASNLDQELMNDGTPAPCPSLPVGVLHVAATLDQAASDYGDVKLCD